MLAILCAFLAGALGWTFTEYVLHRFVFHGASARGPGAKEHRRHHAQVEYFAPAWQKALAALAAIAVLFPLLALLFDLASGAAATLGFVAMYVFYEVLHRRAHTHSPRNRYGRWRRKHHFAHHFADPRRAQGVTTPLWDVVFGTRLRVEKVRVPRRLAMRWLVDDQGEVCPAYAADYTLVGSPRRDETVSGEASAAI
jgi:sterol desaturase/sphingolipid hydroxylase (fatty acid hydroxylase superfamily)